MGRQIILTKEQEEKIIYNYTILHYGQKKSGAFIPVSDSVVRRVLKKYNIPIKSIQETNVNKLWVKHDYFQTQSPYSSQIYPLQKAWYCSKHQTVLNNSILAIFHLTQQFFEKTSNTWSYFLKSYLKQNFLQLF